MSVYNAKGCVDRPRERTVVRCRLELNFHPTSSPSEVLNRVLWKLLLLFCTVPIIELALLLWIGEHMGWLATLALVLVTGTAGAMLARHQGWRCITRIQQELKSGETPSATLVDGLLIIIAGALLLTPGLLTDVFGFSLLIPWTRHWVRRRLSGYFRSRVQWQVVPGGRSSATSEDSQPYIVDVPSKPLESDETTDPGS